MDGRTSCGHAESSPAPTAADPEIPDRPRRRSFAVAEKLRILKLADQAAGMGGVGAVLRSHGLYSFALSDWPRQRDAGILGTRGRVRRGPKPAPANPLSAELAGARRDVAQLRQRLQRAEAIIEVQKKRADLLGVPRAPHNVP